MILYEGPSRIDGKPIVAILTPKSENAKTGDMEQLFILRQDIPPLSARSAGEDESICGDCKMRWSLGGACYVFRGPEAVWQKYKRGGYKHISVHDLNKFKPVRLSAYGDMTALPKDIAQLIVSTKKFHTAYTHGWKKNKWMSDFSMASVDSLKEKQDAKRLGFRTFRVLKKGESPQEDEIICPNTTKGIQCAQCLLCAGNKVKAKNIAIEVHGVLERRFV